jgi:hypothetical protein
MRFRVAPSAQTRAFGASRLLTEEFNTSGVLLYPFRQGGLNLIEYLRILDGGGHRPLITIRDFLDGAAQDLA